MDDITKAEMSVVLTLVKSPEVLYNANNLSKVVGITPMGCLKILKRLEQDSIVKVRIIGNAKIYKINTEESYTKKYVSLVLAREAKKALSHVRRWLYELKKIKHADIIVLFGSVLRKENPQDIDVLLVTDKKRFSKLQEEIKIINSTNIKKIHPMYQTKRDIIQNIKRRDKPLLSAIKGIIVSGEEKFIEVSHESSKE